MVGDYGDFDELIPDEEPEPPVDEARVEARKEIGKIFSSYKEGVFFSRQIEIWLEDKYFHWISNKAIRELMALRIIVGEERKLRTGGRIHLLWNPSYRYYKREAAKVVNLVEEYADPNISAAIGLHGESMVLEGFARNEFVMKGKNVRRFGSKEWTSSEHNMDFIFERDGLAYGLEVKNTLGYMDHKEFQLKIKLCKYLGIRPVFVARMLPKTWMKEVIDSNGFGLILKYQLYPWTHRELAKRVAKEFRLPIDAPRAIADGTMARFMKWHRRQV